MKTITIDRRDIQASGFLTPRENQGQMVNISYACTEDYILMRTWDANDRSEQIVAYRWPSTGDFNPNHVTPKTGRRVGVVEIV